MVSNINGQPLYWGQPTMPGAFQASGPPTAASPPGGFVQDANGNIYPAEAVSGVTQPQILLAPGQQFQAAQSPVSISPNDFMTAEQFNTIPAAPSARINQYPQLSYIPPSAGIVGMAPPPSNEEKQMAAISQMIQAQRDEQKRQEAIEAQNRAEAAALQQQQAIAAQQQQAAQSQASSSSGTSSGSVDGTSSASGSSSSSSTEASKASSKSGEADGAEEPKEKKKKKKKKKKKFLGIF